MILENPEKALRTFQQGQTPQKRSNARFRPRSLDLIWRRVHAEMQVGVANSSRAHAFGHPPENPMRGSINESPIEKLNNSHYKYEEMQ